MRPRTVLILSLAPALSFGQEADVPRDFPKVDQLPEVAELPDPFVFLDGSTVENREDWRRRREEMVAMVLHYQFGHAPAVPKIIIPQCNKN